MVETGHISHNGFLIWTSSVHNIYEEAGGETVVMKTNMYRHDRGHVIITKGHIGTHSTYYTGWQTWTHFNKLLELLTDRMI